MPASQPLKLLLLLRIDYYRYHIRKKRKNDPADSNQEKIIIDILQSPPGTQDDWIQKNDLK